MNLRSALKAFVESSHSCLCSPAALVSRSAVFHARSSSLSISDSQSFRSLSSLDCSHLSRFSHFHSFAFNRRFRFDRCVGRPVVVQLESDFDSTCDPEASPLSCSVSGKFKRSAFSASAMSLSSEPSLQSLSLRSPESQEHAEANDSLAVDEAVKEDVLVQYIVIRRDLVTEQNWPLGSIISQGCHAAVAAIWLYKDDPETALYCRPENLDHMHKVTLEVKGETQLRNLAQKLETAGVAHKLWIEQPENYSTCLATKPYHKSKVASHFKKLKLCR